ncbi:MAG: hypothetical protein GXX82_02090 [Syntrophorhabdus sp.]|jgi:hypothetical protein|nr:hypothetical protein [Syntrophorhabdus sp.]
MMTKTISEKNTKTEIIEAYNEVLAKLKEQKAVNQQAVKKETEVKESLKEASANSIDDIVRNLAGLKVQIVKTIDDLEEKMIAEYRKFSGLQQAATEEARILDELYGVQAEADSLAALVQAQKEKKASFEAQMEQTKASFDEDMSEKRQYWKKEQEEFDLAKKERDAQLKKDRLREEEEYSYNLQLARKKDADEYEATKTALEKELSTKKSALEKDWSEREAVLSSREEELSELRDKIAVFPKELEKAIKDTEKTVTERIEFKFKHEMQLIQKETEGEQKLHEQAVEALQSKIREQEELIRQLTQKADESVQQVQTIAVKAIEGASAQRIVTERVKEA